MKKTGTFPGVRKTSSGAEEALTQGMKVNDMRYLSVTEQGDELCFYKPNRNEPVPPDPAIISAVKPSVVVPPPKHAIPPNITPGKIKSNHRPSINWFRTPAVLSSIPVPAHSRPVEIIRNANTSCKANGCTNTEIENKFSSLKVSSSEKCMDGSSATDASISSSSKKNDGGSPAVRLFWRSQNQNTSSGDKTSSETVDSSKSKPPEVKVKQPETFLNASDGTTEVRVVKQFSSKEFVVFQHSIAAKEKLVTLEKEIFSWIEGNKISPVGENEFVKNGLYALRPSVSISKICFRARLLSVSERPSKTHVYLVDHGDQRLVNIKHLFPLKPEWAQVEQLSCLIRVNNTEFQEEMNNKIIFVQPIRSVDIKIPSVASGNVDEIVLSGCEVAVSGV